MRGASFCLPDRHFFLEGKKGELLLMEGGSLFEFREAKSQPSVEGVAEYMGDNGKIKGKEGNLVAEKKHGVDAKYCSGNDICGYLEEMTKLVYAASLLSKRGRRLGLHSFKKIFLFSISAYSHLSQDRRRF